MTAHNAAANAPLDDRGALATVVAGERLLLFPERGLFIPRFSAVVVADLHWGKAATFRAAGVPIPSGTTSSDLARLGTLIERTGASRVVVLGDLLHARAGRQRTLFDALHAWRERHARTEIVLVRGNHDAHAGDPPASLDIAVVDGPWTLGPFTCDHEPLSFPGRYLLAGHLHPSITLGGRGRLRERLPCFAFGKDVGILPAFTEFTGGGAWVPEGDESVFAIAGEEVIRVK